MKEQQPMLLMKSFIEELYSENLQYEKSLRVEYDNIKILKHYKVFIIQNTKIEIIEKIRMNLLSNSQIPTHPNYYVLMKLGNITRV